jgi:hypothetical protein
MHPSSINAVAGARDLDNPRLLLPAFGMAFDHDAQDAAPGCAVVGIGAADLWVPLATLASEINSSLGICQGTEVGPAD